jgi:mannitol/fructose-specific phosphotransferase system IIA component (Ntr-type)
MRLTAASRHAAIDELTARVSAVVPDTDVAEISRAVHAREETMGTGIGEGIAVPHARIPSLARPIVVFGRSLEGIDWNAVDDQPAHFVFLILTPSEDAGSQLHILSSISRGLASEAARSKLLHASDEEDALAQLREVFAESSRA